MSAQIIDGKELAKTIKQDLKTRIEQLDAQPGLALILVGDDPASHVYVSSKEKTCNKLGMHCERHNLPADTNEMQLLELITKLNNDTNIHGILVQLPLPKHINEKIILDAILSHKDVDGFTPINLGHLLSDDTIIASATPKACMKLIESTGEKIQGKHAVVIGRSRIVGKPVALLLLEQNATVTICHSRTQNLADITKQADILIAAVGRPNLVTADMVKPGAIVIDVGINRLDDKLVGDVDFESVKEVAGHITPVPGGVGPMTITMLMENVLEAMQLAQKLHHNTQ